VLGGDHLPMSFASALTRSAFCAYAGSRARRCPYSATIVPQPLAVMTIASAPDSTCGHHASILATDASERRILRIEVVFDGAAAAGLRNGPTSEIRGGRVRAPWRR